MNLSSKIASFLLFCATATGLAADGGYLFTSFRGSGDGLHLAYSLDGKKWTDLNRVFLTPTVGAKLLRDPQILLGPDGLYHMVWTTGWKDTGIGYATSKDLVTWSDQQYLPLMAKVPGTRTCWAPELFYDETTSNYIIMWSSEVKAPGAGEPKLRAYYSLTTDFKTFTDPKILFDPGFNNLDTTMVRVGNKYVIVFKEADNQTGKKWGPIHSAIADQPLGPYELQPKPIIENERVEGPALATVDGKTLLYFDYYSNGRYGVRETADWKTWTDITGTTAVVSGQRHGSILPVPADLLANLRKSEQAAIDRAPKPILEGFTADPAIRVFGDTYYVYPTSDKPNWNTNEFAVWSSKNLVDWKKEGVFMDLAKGDVKWANIKAWAPDCIERNGTYYFYFCAEGKIGVATAKTPIGPFSDALGKPLLERKGKTDKRITSNTIDPYPFIDDDGQAYLYWGNSNGIVNVVKLKPDMITVDGDPIEFQIKGGDATFREGLVIFKRGGKYYFMWSVDDARSENYRIGYGTADHPLGPVSIAADPIVLRKNGPAKGTGHHSVVNVPGTDRWYAVYHRHAIPDGSGYKRQTCLVRMEFNPDGTIKPMDPMTTPFRAGDVGEPLVNGKGSPTDPKKIE